MRPCEWLPQNPEIAHFNMFVHAHRNAYELMPQRCRFVETFNKSVENLT
jgi:hypothetical protein